MATKALENPQFFRKDLITPLSSRKLGGGEGEGGGSQST